MTYPSGDQLNIPPPYSPPGSLPPQWGGGPPGAPTPRPITGPVGQMPNRPMWPPRVPPRYGRGGRWGMPPHGRPMLPPKPGPVGPPLPDPGGVATMPWFPNDPGGGQWLKPNDPIAFNPPPPDARLPQPMPRQPLPPQYANPPVSSKPPIQYMQPPVDTLNTLGRGGVQASPPRLSSVMKKPAAPLGRDGSRPMPEYGSATGSSGGQAPVQSTWGAAEKRRMMGGERSATGR